MPFAPLPTRKTIRDQIMDWLVDHFETDVHPDRPTWNVVTRDPISNSNLQDAVYAVGIYDVSETIKEAVQVDYRNLNVVIEFHVQTAEGDKPSTFLNHCLGSIASRIGEDIHAGGLALNMTEKGSELDIDGAFDNYCGGIIVFDVGYRCRSNDPYTRA